MIKNVQKLELEGYWARLGPKICLLRQNIWNKMEEFSKTGKEKKSLVSFFAYFLIAIGKFLKGDLAIGNSSFLLLSLVADTSFMSISWLVLEL